MGSFNYNVDNFRLASRLSHPENTIIEVGNVTVGGDRIVVMAGPCSLDTRENLDYVIEGVSNAGASFIRAGAYKPRTCPYSFQGLGEAGIRMLADAKKQYGIPVISEIVGVRDVALFNDNVDIIQVGARNMQNYELLKELGKLRKPIMLKRGFGSSLEELLMSAEYILAGGNPNVILCERGVRVPENGMRSALDLTAIPILKSMTHLPVFVDPSHGTGDASLIEPMSRASIAAGADGLIIEVHKCPSEALSDGMQSITPCQFADMMKSLRKVALAVDREI